MSKKERSSPDLNPTLSLERAFTARTSSKVLLAGLCIIVLLAALGPINIAIGITLSLIVYLGMLYLAQAHGARDVALLKVEEHVANIETGFPISIVNNELFEQTDNAFSLSLALEHIGAGNDTVLVLDGDILFELALLKELIESPFDNACIIDNPRNLY